MWSELGKLKHEQRTGPVDMGWMATGTGVIIEQRVTEGEGCTVRKSTFAKGAEPQILAGEKSGLLGTVSEPLGDKLARVGEEVLGVPVDEAARKARDGVKDDKSSPM